jgi:hypothetical protein
VLARGLRGNWYSPLSADPTGVAGLDFYQILAQPPIPFPHPATSTELDAFQYIARHLCRSDTCNPRDSYPDTNISIETWENMLQAINDPSTGMPCETAPSTTAPSTPFCLVHAQLLLEFDYVADIRLFNTNLTTLYGESETDSILAMLSTYNTIQATLQAPPAAPAPSLVGPIVNLFLDLASFIPKYGPIFGIADTLFNFGTSLTTDASGNQTINLSSTVATLQQDARLHFEAGLTTAGIQFDFIYQDWGKISALGAALEEAPEGSPWYWDTSKTIGEILTAMAPAIEQSYYQSLMAAIYAIGSYLPECIHSIDAAVCPFDWGNTPLWMQPRAYWVYDPRGPFPPGAGHHSQPFFFPPWYPPYTFPGDMTNPTENPANPAHTQASATLLADNAWLGISLQSSPADSGLNGLYDPPDLGILASLFTPPSMGGKGVYRPAFFEGWPFPRVICDQSEESGCNWSAAAPHPNTLPAPLTSISIRPGRMTRDGNRLRVPLAIHNSGTIDFASVEIREIALGVGPEDAALLGPSLPIYIGKLTPGTFGTITLTLEVSDTLDQLELTEVGTVDTGESSPHHFRLSQVIFPKDSETTP